MKVGGREAPLAVVATADGKLLRASIDGALTDDLLALGECNRPVDPPPGWSG